MRSYKVGYSNKVTEESVKLDTVIEDVLHKVVVDVRLVGTHGTHYRSLPTDLSLSQG